MQVSKVQNQTNFSGRAYMLSEAGQIFYKNAVKQINSMNTMRSADFNLYIGESAFFPNKFCVVAAKSENEINEYPRKTTTGRLTNRHVSAIIETAKTVIAEHNEKLNKKLKHEPFSFQKFKINLIQMGDEFLEKFVKLFQDKDEV